MRGEAGHGDLPSNGRQGLAGSSITRPARPHRTRRLPGQLRMNGPNSRGLVTGITRPPVYSYPTSRSRGRILPDEVQAVAFADHADRVAFPEPALDQRHGKRVLEELADHPLEGPRAVLGFVTLFRKE